MRKRNSLIFAALLLGAVFLGQAHAAQSKKIRLAFSALAYANPPFWIAHDLKLFEKYGLESEIVYVGGSRPIQAMLGGSIDVSQVGGAAAVSAIAQGAEVAIVLSGTGVPSGLLATKLEPEEMLPCVGHAAIGIEVRENDPKTAPICAQLNDIPTMQCVTAERAFLKAMGGGCQLAVAAYAEQRLRDIGIDAWRNPQALTVVFPQLPEPVCEKWQLATAGGTSHIICMPHVRREQIDELIADIEAAGGDGPCTG